MNRRNFLKLGTGVIAGGFLGGHVLAPLNSCIVRRRKIPLSGIPDVFDGFRIAHLADFHAGPWVSDDHIGHAVELANRLKPHAIVLTGDFVHSGARHVEGCFEHLAKLSAPYGVFAVLGNHDHYGGAEKSVRLALKRSNIEELTNAGVDLWKDGQTLRLGGVGDLWEDRQRTGVALGTSGLPDSAILLSHNPDFAETLTDDRVGLVLSGHTHGGQCVFPGIGAPILPSKYGQKYASGLCRAPVAKVFVTTGVGHSFPPIRFNCPAEVALLTLRKAFRLDS